MAIGGAEVFAKDNSRGLVFSLIFQCRKFMFRTFLFLCVYLPFQLALNPTEGVDLASGRVFILLLFFVWLADSLKNKKLIIEKNIQTGLIAVFLFLSALSIVVAQNVDWSLRKLLFLFSVFPIYFVASALIGDLKKAEKAAKWLVAGGFAAAIIGIVQFLAQFIWSLEKTYQLWAEYVVVPFLGKSFSAAVLQNPSWLVNISGRNFLRATSVFPDPHMLSFYLGMSGALCLGLILAGEKRKIFWIIFATIMMADFLTFSRGGYLGIFCAAVVMLMIFWRKASRRMKGVFFGLVFLLAVILAIPNPVSQRFFSSFDFQEGSNAGRIATWRQALEVVGNKPWLGAGLGNYPLEIKPTANYREPIYAHNAFLDVAAETGILNSLVFAGIIIAGALGFWKKAKQDSFFIGCFLALIVFFVHSLVETPIYSASVSPLLLIILSFNNIKNE